jgi:hypothetical protein
VSMTNPTDRVEIITPVQHRRRWGPNALAITRVGRAEAAGTGQERHEGTARMHLSAFRVFKYRNIGDSGLVTLADRLNCIVGKNQSGKTNLLKALQKFNPHDKAVKYDVRTDWPRGSRQLLPENRLAALMADLFRLCIS